MIINMLLNAELERMRKRTDLLHEKLWTREIKTVLRRFLEARRLLLSNVGIKFDTKCCREMDLFQVHTSKHSAFRCPTNIAVCQSCLSPLLFFPFVF